MTTSLSSDFVFHFSNYFKLAVISLLLSGCYSSNSYKGAGDRCFCQLQGQIDDCSCNVDTVDHFNNVQIYPRLSSLLNKNYFRYFKVNLKRPCPFWDDDSHCVLKDCSVHTCTEEQVPEGLKTKRASRTTKNNSAFKYTKEGQQEDCTQTAEEDNELGILNKTLSPESIEEFERWQEHDDAQENFCEMDDENSADMQYVDLLLNPEAYTGYKGASAHRIWRSIYRENCFDSGSFLDSHSLGGMCLEKRAFYRAISGLHTSINIHLSARYLNPPVAGFGVPGWGRNVKEFQKRFDPETTGSEGPNWLKNLYFLYLLELRAIAKAAPYLERELLFTGNDQEDADVQVAVKSILDVIKTFPEHFNESSMFAANDFESKKLKGEFKNHFRNISRIMDCVGCEKCRLWGKLQIQGLGTALKILFSGQPSGEIFSLSEMKKTKFQLTRQEIVSLLNAFGRLSNSVYELENFRKIS